MLAELGAGRAEPALGSLPGMSFRREVLSGKGRSLNHWGRPIAFLEGSSSDSPKRLPPKCVLCLAQNFLSGHCEPWGCAALSAAGEPTPARYWGRKTGAWGAWGDALAPVEPVGALWALEWVEWRKPCLAVVVFSAPITALCCCPLICWSLVRAYSHAGDAELVLCRGREGQG